MSLTFKIKKALLKCITSSIQPASRRRQIRKDVTMAWLNEGDYSLPDSKDDEIAQRECLLSSLKACQEGFVLIIDHNWGGGANAYREKRIKQLHQDGKNVLLTYYCDSRKLIIATLFLTNEQKVHGTLNSLYELSNYPKLQIHHIIVNILASWESGKYVGMPETLVPQGIGRDIPEILEQIVWIAEKTGASIEHCYHDHFPLCPGITLLNSSGHYCDIERDYKVCADCLEHHPVWKHTYLHIDRWRQAWQFYFDHVDKVVFFSNNSQELFNRVFSVPTERIQVVPHEPLEVFDKTVAIQTTSYPIVGIVGTIQLHKGSELLLEVAKKLLREQSDIRFVIIGELLTKRNIPSNIVVTGKFKHEDLPNLLEKNSVNIGLIPSIWPETFSYTTQELMQLGLPVICFDLGAPAERVKNYKKGFIVPEVDADSLIQGIREFFKKLYA